MSGRVHGGLRVIRDLPDTDTTPTPGGHAFTFFDLFGETGSARIPPPAPALPGGRIVPRSCTERPGDAKAALRPRLVALGSALERDAARAPRADSTIPAVYTYFGQFIAHDLTEPLAPEPADTSPDAPTAALDLGDIFRTTPRAPDPQTCAGHAGSMLGLSSRGRRADLPRDAAGRPCIVDVRNDNNLGCAQITVALMRFVEAVAARFPDRPKAEQRRIAMRHVQSIALFDYLPRLVGPGLADEVLSEGRAVFRPKGTATTRDMLVPIEFSQAAFRVGHSMVRGMYRNWSPAHPRAELDELFDFTHLGRLRRPFHRPLDDDWVTDWAHLSDRLDGTPAAVTSAALGDPLNYRMFWLDPAFFEAHDLVHAELIKGRIGINLATFTLLRGLASDLATAAEALTWVNAALAARGRAPVPVLPTEEILALQGPETRAVLTAGPRPLTEEMPLWLYCLAEARAEREGFGGGNRLGPLAGRIVAETLHAAVEAADGGIVTPDQTVDFAPDPRLTPRRGTTHFSMAELLRVAAEADASEKPREEAMS